MYKHINSMSGYEFEEYCVKILRLSGFCNIEQTKLSGDFGIDIVAKRNGAKIGIQCKRYSNPVGVKAVQEAISGSIYYGCSESMVLSNQDFTPQAMDMASKAKVILTKIDDLIKIANNPVKAAYNVLIPADNDVIALAKKICEAFYNIGVHIEIENAQLGNNETIFYVKKEDSDRLNKIFSLKREVVFQIKRNFDIKIDYEKQILLFIFLHRDIVGYSEEIKAKSTNTDCNAEISGKDRLFIDAGRFIIGKDKVSIGLIQRNFKISFNHASKIMDELCEAGVIGEQEGTVPRKVHMSMEQFEKYLGKNP